MISLKNLRIIFLILLTFLMTLEILIPAFSEDLTVIFIHESKARDSFKIDIYVSSIYTELICTVGLYAHFKNNYRVIRVFNLFEGINCIFSLYITIRVFSLSLLTVLNLTLLYVGSKFERHLRQELHQTTDNRRQNVNRNRADIMTISRNNLHTMSDSQQTYCDPSPEYEAPPPYSLVELAQLQKLEHEHVSTSSC